MIARTCLVRTFLTRMDTKIGRVGLWLSALNYAQAGVGFAINFYLAWRLGAATYGVVSYGIVAGTIIYTIANFGAERTLVRDLVQRADDRRILTASILLRTGLGLSILLLLLAVLPRAIENAEKVRVVVVSAAASLFWASAPVAWFDARYQMHRHAAIVLAERVLYGLLVAVFLTDGGAGSALQVMVYLLLTRAVSTLVQLMIVGRSEGFEAEDLPGNIRWLVKGNALIVLAALANLLISHWNQLVLEHELSSADLGYYALAFQIVSVVTLLQNQVLRIFFPRIAALTSEGANPAAARKALPRYAVFSAALSVVIVVPVFLAAPKLIDVAYPDDFRASLDPLRYLCLWVVFNGGARVVNAFLINLRLDRAFFLCAIGAGVTAVILGRPLITAFGASGVALALLISHPLSVAAQAVVTERELRRRIVAAG